MDIVDTTIEVPHVTTTVLSAYAMMHHTKDHPHEKVPQLIPEIAADPDHILHISQVRTPHLNLHLILAGLH